MSIICNLVKLVLTFPPLAVYPILLEKDVYAPYVTVISRKHKVVQLYCGSGSASMGLPWSQA